MAREKEIAALTAARKIDRQAPVDPTASAEVEKPVARDNANAPDTTAGPLRSLEASVETKITFVNHSRTPILTYWIDYQGAEVFYHEIAPNDSFTEQTYVTHPWRVKRKRNGAMVKTVVASAARQTIVIDPAGQ